MHESPINHCAHRDCVYINVDEVIGSMTVSAVKLVSIGIGKVAIRIKWVGVSVTRTSECRKLGIEVRQVGKGR